MVVSFKYLLRIWLIMIVVQVLWLRYQPINKKKLGTTCARVACAIWHLFLVVVVGFPNWHVLGCQEQVGWGTWLGSRCRKSCFGIFIFMIIILSHETISSSLSSLVSTVVSDGKGGLPVGSAPSAIICFHEKQINSERPTTKNYFGLTSNTSCVQCRAWCTLRWTLDTGHAVQCKEILPRSRVPWIS